MNKVKQKSNKKGVLKKTINKKKPKKDKNHKKFQTTKIKKEPTEVLPLSHYVPDRVELVRQAFSVLKKKSIKNILPDFMKKKSIDDIRASVLDEVLCISKKRLLSIINKTKCPTDTESSNSDSEKVIEHISLDEISSDSEDERRKNRQKNKSIVPADPQSKKDTNTQDVPIEAKKKMSILELLELQARARAIRSQLALEPVTKIEIDSDDDSECGAKNHSRNKKSTVPTKKTTSVSRSAARSSTAGTVRIIPGTSKTKTASSTITSSSSKPASSTLESIKTTISLTNTTSEASTSVSAPVSNRPRLKRNFRKQMFSDEQKTESDPPIVAPVEIVVPPEKSTELIEKKIRSDEDVVKKEISKELPVLKREVIREPSPDVVPIVPFVETVTIDSDSDMESRGSDSKSSSDSSDDSDSEPEIPSKKIKESDLPVANDGQSKVANKVIILSNEVVVIADEKDEVDKDRDFLQTIKKSSKDQSVLEKPLTIGEAEAVLNKIPDSVNAIVEEEKKVDEEEKKVEEKEKKDEEDEEEPEEGEIFDEESDPNDVEMIDTDKGDVLEINDSSEEEEIEKMDEKENSTNSNSPEMVVNEDSTAQDGIDDKKSEKSDEEDDIILINDDDDSIDLNKSAFSDDSDVEKSETKNSNTEPKENSSESLTEDKSHRKPIESKSDDKSMTSESENPENDTSGSWQDRWLRSKKVSTILATARLGNKVRIQLKNKSRSKKTAAVAAAKTTECQNVVDSSAPTQDIAKSSISFEEGSVQQYEQIMASEPPLSESSPGANEVDHSK